MYKILGTPVCSFCNQAKELLSSKGLDYEYVDITTDPDSLKIFQDKGFRTVPQIFTDTGEHIGGYQDLLKHLNS